MGKTIKKRTSFKQRKFKDKKGNAYTELVEEEKPYEDCRYMLNFVCDSCGYSFQQPSRIKEKAYLSFDNFKKARKRTCIRASAVFIVVFSILLGFLIAILVEPYGNRLQRFINDRGSNNSYYSSLTLGRSQVKTELDYRDDGFTLDGNNYDYRFIINDYPSDDCHYKSLKAAVLFNLDNGSDSNFVGTSSIEYATSSTVAYQYSDITGDSYYDLSYGASSYTFSPNWNSDYDAYKDEWKFYSWYSIKSCFLGLEDVCNDAGFDIYKAMK